MNIKIILFLNLSLLLSVNCILGQETKITPFNSETGIGYAVSSAISGDYAIVGAFTDDVNGASSGSAFIYKRNGGIWENDIKITPTNGAKNSNFGCAVSISGDYAIIGAYQAGFAYIFKRSNNIWEQDTLFTVSNDNPYALFYGESVFINGDYAIVGNSSDIGNGNYYGAAYIYKKTGDIWVKEAKLLPDIGANNGFGFQVAINNNYAIVSTVNSIKGQVYIFENIENNWVKNAIINHPKGIDAQFGYSVSINDDNLIVGTGNMDQAAYIYKKELNNWLLEAEISGSDVNDYEEYGKSVSIYNDYAIVGAPKSLGKVTYGGACYLYKKESTNWLEIAKISASDEVFGKNFGFNVSISERSTIICAPSNWNNNEAAYIYELDSPTRIQNINNQNLIRIFPNPANDNIYFENLGQGKIKKVKIINQIGGIQFIKEGNIKSIDISKYPKGIYVIELDLEYDKIKKKLIIN